MSKSYGDCLSTTIRCGNSTPAQDALADAAPDLLTALKLEKDRITEVANADDSCWADWPGSYEIDDAIARAEGDAHAH